MKNNLISNIMFLVFLLVFFLILFWKIFFGTFSDAWQTSNTLDRGENYKHFLEYVDDIKPNIRAHGLKYLQDFYLTGNENNKRTGILGDAIVKTYVYIILSVIIIFLGEILWISFFGKRLNTKEKEKKSDILISIIVILGIIVTWFLLLMGVSYYIFHIVKGASFGDVVELLFSLFIPLFFTFILLYLICTVRGMRKVKYILF